MDTIITDPSVESIAWVRTVRHLRILNFTAGKYLTLSSKVSRGNKDTPEYLASDDYVQNVDTATRMGVILSDTAKGRHWLADGASVALRFCRAWLSKPHSGYIPQHSSTILQSPQDAGSPSTSLATLTSIENGERELYVSNTKRLSKPVMGGRDLEVVVERQWFLLQDLAHRYVKWIEQMHDRANKLRLSPDFDLVRQGNKIIGFEFLDLLHGVGRLDPCVLELGNGAKPWLPYTRSTDVVHILGSGFGELVQPEVPYNRLPVQCGQRSTAPRHTDYLIAPLSVLRVNMERLQHTDTCAQLARGLYWWNTDEAFQECRCQCTKASARCTSLVKKLHGRCLEGSSPRTPTCLPEIFRQCPNGAIIIGYEQQLLIRNTPTTDNFIPRFLNQSVQEQPGASRITHHQKRSSSDSGYASNTGNSSHGSQTSSLVFESPSLEGFRIRGAAGETGGKKLTKRRKTEH
jgi:hypothetical protein